MTGLSTALSNLASLSAFNTLNTTVTGIVNDSTYVHTSSGTIPNNKLDTGVVTYGGGVLSTVGGTTIPINQQSVTSVNTKTGAVVLTAADVSAIAVGAVSPSLR